LAALVDVVFRRIELVGHEVELRRVGEILDREDRLEDGLQPLIGAAARRLLHQQELVVGRLLNLDEVRHLRDFLNFPEKFSYALATRKRLRHVLSLCPVGAPGTALRKAAIIATVRTNVRMPTSSRFGGSKPTTSLAGPRQRRRFRVVLAPKSSICILQTPDIVSNRGFRNL